MNEAAGLLSPTIAEMKILVVEDCPELLFAYEHNLTKKGYKVITAPDGQSAINVIESEDISLVLLDVVLPDISGFEILRRIKSNPSTCNIYVALISSMAIHPDHQVQGLESGAEAYLLKPISNKELGAHIDSLIKHKQADDVLRLNEQIYRMQSEKAEKALRESNAYLHLLMDNNSVAYIAFDKDCRVQFFNKRAQLYAEKFLQKSLEVGSKLENLIVSDYENSLQNNVALAYSGKSFSVERSFMHDNGKPGWADFFYSPSTTEDGEVKGVLLSISDISERKQIEQDLIEARKKAEESDRLKTAFMHNMSHEIRTPMNAIMGFSGLMAENYKNKDKLERFAGIISTRCNDLLEILDGILEIASLESGQLSLNYQVCNLPNLFAELKQYFEGYQKRINKQQINFSLKAGCDPSILLITADIDKLKQIFTSLIGNAFKFTETGTIEAGCKADSNQNLIFYVTDTGIGIPADKHQVIFERFTQLKQDSNLDMGGTGLGLAIVKGLLDLMSGHIWLESTPGSGTTFYFTFPYTTLTSGVA